MKTTIETRFNVGDAVYIADHYYRLYANKAPYIVKEINIIVRNDGIRVLYEVEQDGATESVAENFMFFTYDECAAWCDANN